MKSRRYLPLIAASFVLAASATAFSLLKKADSPGNNMTAAANTFLDALSEKERDVCLMDYDTPKRVDWHFIPKKTRKGVQLRDLSEKKRKLAMKLVRTALSESGYEKSVKIMELESVLNKLEKGKGRFARDPLKYYVTIFGTPSEKGRWGLSFEGHHLSLNYVIDGGEVESSTPQFFAANPAIVMESYIPTIDEGTRVLKAEEALAFDLVNSLDAKQAKQAVFAEKAPREIRAAGDPQPPQTEPIGVAAADLNKKQTKLLQGIISAYCDKMPEPVAAERLDRIKKHGLDKVHFAWGGAKKPGVGHYYRIQGPSFLVEFVNTQPDAAGNPANHIHCVWRDMAGDFGLPIAKK